MKKDYFIEINFVCQPNSYPNGSSSKTIEVLPDEDAVEKFKKTASEYYDDAILENVYSLIKLTLWECTGRQMASEPDEASYLKEREILEITLSDYR